MVRSPLKILLFLFVSWSSLYTLHWSSVLYDCFHTHVHSGVSQVQISFSHSLPCCIHRFCYLSVLFPNMLSCKGHAIPELCWIIIRPLHGCLLNACISVNSSKEASVGLLQGSHVNRWWSGLNGILQSDWTIICPGRNTKIGNKRIIGGCEKWHFLKWQQTLPYFDFDELRKVYPLTSKWQKWPRSRWLLITYGW